MTREQFVEKRQTIEERLKEEEKRRRHEAEEEALRVRLAGLAGALGAHWARSGAQDGRQRCESMQR